MRLPLLAEDSPAPTLFYAVSLGGEPTEARILWGLLILEEEQHLPTRTEETIRMCETLLRRGECTREETIVRGLELFRSETQDPGLCGRDTRSCQHVLEENTTLLSAVYKIQRNLREEMRKDNPRKASSRSQIYPPSFG